MRSIAVHTLGCKVNQYDTEAMLEQFIEAGYQPVPFDGPADVYLVNTCTVTGSGDHKSMKLIRRAGRMSPSASVIVAGCLAQRDAEAVAALPGVMLVLGTKRRGEVRALFERAEAEGRPIIAVESLADAPFEPLRVTRHQGRTRAVMKIQEGCACHCSYCIIPSVRGPVRSMPLADVRQEAMRLAEAGYLELVLTGIHLSSYGHDLGLTLIEAIEAVHAIEGVRRIRLGSLEPLIADEAFVARLAALPKICRQFHLALQSGSDPVLKSMRRRYTTDRFMQAAQRIRRLMPDAALTTDVLCGFPGETDEQADETLAFIRAVGFSRIHVFPYSARAGTDAAQMDNPVTNEKIKRRAAELLELGNQLERLYAQKAVGSRFEVLFEDEAGSMAEGYTGQYLRVRANGRPGQIATVAIDRLESGLAVGHIVEGSDSESG